MGWLLYKGTLDQKKGKGYHWATKIGASCAVIVARLFPALAVILPLEGVRGDALVVDLLARTPKP